MSNHTNMSEKKTIKLVARATANSHFDVLGWGGW